MLEYKNLKQLGVIRGKTVGPVVRSNRAQVPFTPKFLDVALTVNMLLLVSFVVPNTLYYVLLQMENPRP